MPRQPRCRCIRNFPAYWSFSPDDPTEQPVIMLTLDEYETIRLLDREAHAGAVRGEDADCADYSDGHL